MPDRPPGDVSRHTFDPRRRFTGVRQQQGRVQLDADWNEQVDIVDHRLRTQLVDLVGPSGAPQAAPGFGLVPRGALRFDGRGQFVTLGDAGAGVGAVGSLVIDLEIKLRSPGSGAALLARFDAAGDDVWPAVAWTLGEDGGLRIALGGGSGEPLPGAVPVRPGRWVWVRLVHGVDRCAAWVDGRAAGHVDRGVPRPPTSAVLEVGRVQRGAAEGPALNGALREARLLDAGSGDVLAHWRFDGKAGGALTDRTSHGHRARLGGDHPSTRPTLVELDDLQITPGRLYVDGLTAVHDRLCSVDDQAALPGATLPADTSPGCAYLFYLDAWERYVAPAQDPGLRDPALDDGDTAGRTTVAAQVRWIPVNVSDGVAPSCVDCPEWRTLASGVRRKGHLRVRHDRRVGTEVENRVYRVQVHGTAPEQRWKWSRDNGSVVLPLEPLSEPSRAVRVRPTWGRSLPISVGSRLEVADDRSLLSDAAAPLAVVTEVDDAQRVIGLDRATGSLTSGARGTHDIGSDGTLRPVAIRWEGEDALEPGTWFALEHGIEVRFEPGDVFQPGDHWTFTTRETTGTIDWPTGEAETAARPADGITHHVTALATLSFGEAGFELRDCRHTFGPLGAGGVRRVGDTMTGPLAIRPDPPLSDDQDALSVQGPARAARWLGPLGSPDAVASRNLVDAAVTREKLAPEVGIVPPGFAILGDSDAPPSGYVWTGSTVVTTRPTPEWTVCVRRALGAHPGELRSVAIGPSVFTFADNGDAWRFDVGTWELSPLTAGGVMGRRRFGVAAVGGRIYVVGGLDDEGRKVSATTRYDPTRDVWASRSDMPTPRCDLEVVAFADRLYAIGGLRDVWVGDVVTRRVEVYDPATDAWASRRRLPAGRHAFAAAAGPDGISVMGGHGRWLAGWLGRSLSATTYEYGPVTDRWQRRSGLMPVPRGRGGAVALGDQVFLAGGDSLLGPTDEVLRHTVTSDLWQRLSALGTPLGRPGVALVGGRLVVHGADPASGTLTVWACPVATVMYVHRKTGTEPGPEAS